MKKILAILVFSLATFASFAKPPVAEKVLKQFSAAFPTVSDAKWFEGDGHYDVYFEQNQKKYVIRYDLNGKIVSSRNYYSGDNLCPFLKAKVGEKYPGKSIYGVTEITDSNEMYYSISLEDAKSWTMIRVNGIGQITEVEKLQKSSK